MWPFKKSKSEEPQMMSPGDICFTQLDITEAFGDNERLGPEDWISTTPLNQMNPDGEGSGLPRIGANDAEIYAVAVELSGIRESIAISGDGVYCPICHIANTQLARLHTPCPTCERPLLKFGWD